MMQEHEQYNKGELKVGMTVCTPSYYAYGWQAHYSHPKWKYGTVESISPQGNSVTLVDGRKYTERRYNDYYGQLYKPDDEMQNDTEMFELFKAFAEVRLDLWHILNDFKSMNGAARMEREALEKAVTALKEAKAVLEGQEE